MVEDVAVVIWLFENILLSVSPNNIAQSVPIAFHRSAPKQTKPMLRSSELGNSGPTWCVARYIRIKVGFSIATCGCELKGHSRTSLLQCVFAWFAEVHYRLFSKDYLNQIQWQREYALNVTISSISGISTDATVTMVHMTVILTDSGARNTNLRYCCRSCQSHIGAQQVQ